jgi:hypothetical protein
MRLSIFRLRSLAAADVTLLLTAAAVFATFFFVSLSSSRSSDTGH